MKAEAVLGRIVGILDTLEIPYMLTGSFASSFHGEPRTTQDVDFVIAPDRDQIRNLIRSLPVAEYYADEGAALDALDRESMFNVIDLSTGWKFDFIIRKSRPFSVSEFMRRVSADIAGTAVQIATAEDIVIAKLEWARMGESERQIRDAAGILRSQRRELDMDYIQRWVHELDLATQWQKALAGAGPSLEP